MIYQITETVSNLLKHNKCVLKTESSTYDANYRYYLVQVVIIGTVKDNRDKVIRVRSNLMDPCKPNSSCM